MQRCKYLDDLGLSIENYGTNFVSDDDKRAESWHREQRDYGFDARETWSLNSTFIEWIYTRLMMYKEHAIVDTSYHKIKYQNTEMTQGQIIDRILELSKSLLLEDYYDKKSYENMREICDLWKEVLPYMWW